MDIQAYLQQHFLEKRIVLVGNAPFTEDRSSLIDGYDVVVRFNLFDNPSFQRGQTGRRIHCWCVNLGTGRKKRRDRAEHDRHCDVVKALSPQCMVITPYEEDRRHRLADVTTYYPQRDLTVISPDTAMPTGLPKQPSAGYYFAHRLFSLSIPVAVIGFTGETSQRHDGPEENRRLRGNALVTFHETPSA